MSVFDRVTAAIVRLPNAGDWRRSLIELAWLAPLLAWLGWSGKFVDPGLIDATSLLRVAAIAFFIPALAEELCFRVALLPAPSAPPSFVRYGIAVLASFGSELLGQRLC